MSLDSVTVVVAPARIVALAQSWAKVGLVGRSHWIDGDSVGTSEHWDDIGLSPAVVISVGDQSTTLSLADALAWKDKISQLRIVWVRYADSAQESANAMGLLRDAVLQIKPQGLTDRWFADLIVPRDVRDLAVPPVVQEWQQFVLTPEDRPTPASADTIYGAGTVNGQALHAALILGGVLGGTISDLSDLKRSRLAEPWMIHPFSRVVTGGTRAQTVVRRYLAERLPTLAAADVRPQSFLAADSETSETIIDDAVEWLRSLAGGALRYNATTVGQQDPEWWRKFAQFIKEVAIFSLWALRAMFGIRAIIHWIKILWWRFQRRFESVDMGAALGEYPGGFHYGLKDWAKLEREAARKAKESTERARSEDGTVPPEVVWRAVASLPISLIDGSEAPEGWSPPTTHGRQNSVPPQHIVRTETEIANALEHLPKAEEAGAFRALSRVHRISRSELASAMQHTIDNLHESGRLLHGVDDRPATRTAKLISEASGLADEKFARERTAELASLKFPLTTGQGATHPEALLPRLRARVVGDLLSAEVASAALSQDLDLPPQTSLPKFEPEIRRTARDILAHVAFFTVAIVLISIFRTEIDDVLVQFVPFLGNSNDLLRMIVGAGIVGLVGYLVGLFRYYRAYNEIGKRRTEVIEGRGIGAAAAARESNRLRNADRILSLWVDTLSSPLSAAAAFEAEDQQNPEELPDSLRVAEPEISDEELERMATRKIELGWYARIRDTLISQSIERDSAENIFADDGLTGGLLDTLQREAVDGVLVREAWFSLAESVVSRVRSEVGENTSEVTYFGKDRKPRTITIKKFTSELDSLKSYEPGRVFERKLNSGSESVAFFARGGGTDKEITVSPPLAHVVAGLSLRKFSRPNNDTESATFDNSNGTATKWGR